MPLPMVHLSVAKKYLEQEEISNAGTTFFLGNIAPDSIHMRANITRKNKDETHFIATGEKSINIDKLAELYPKYMAQSTDVEWEWFVRGYFMHVLTDCYWFNSVYPTFTGNPKVSGKTPAEKSSLYYQETDQIDFNLFKQQSWRVDVWKDLKNAKSFDFGTLLTANEICQWRQRTFSFFQDPAKEPNTNLVYITNEIVDNFVNETVKRLREQYQEWDRVLNNESNPIN
ncbi:hypothetical protein [Bacillus sp. FSL K6-3431]|uniref:hypothetical protein n=1 Tax=Bacillus sp. FSL K6-3431 TaxID=2921500 RepID=UPI0030FB3158